MDYKEKAAFTFSPVCSLPIPTLPGIFCMGENRGEGGLLWKRKNMEIKSGETKKGQLSKQYLSSKGIKKWMPHSADLCTLMTYHKSRVPVENFHFHLCAGYTHFNILPICKQFQTEWLQVLESRIISDADSMHHLLTTLQIWCYYHILSISI